MTFAWNLRNHKPFKPFKSLRSYSMWRKIKYKRHICTSKVCGVRCSSFISREPRFMRKALEQFSLSSLSTATYAWHTKGHLCVLDASQSRASIASTTPHREAGRGLERGTQYIYLDLAIENRHWQVNKYSYVTSEWVEDELYWWKSSSPVFHFLSQNSICKLLTRQRERLGSRWL